MSERELLIRWRNWYLCKYGPLGLSPGRKLWEKTRTFLGESRQETADKSMNEDGSFTEPDYYPETKTRIEFEKSLKGASKWLKD